MLKNITLGQYYPADSVVHRLDPRAKIVIALAYIVLVFFVSNYWGYLFLTAALIGASYLAKVPVKYLLRTLKPLRFILIFTFVLNIFFTRTGTPIYLWGDFYLFTSEGIHRAVFMALRMAYLVAGSSMLMLVTSPITLTDGLERLMSPLRVIKFPAHELAMMMSIALRFIPTLTDEADKITFIKDNFRNVKSVLASLGIAAIDGMLMDLGVSSFQLDDAERGFSYQHDAPLDMRMDRQAGKSAYDVVNGYEEREIARILRDFGEERFAGRIARAICERRKEKPVCTTFELSDIVKEAIPAAARREGPHPAKRTFQAIRIEVNHELSILDDTVSDIAELLNPGGRCAVITFHSLEDRIIKSAYARLATGCTCPPDFPVCVCGKKPIFRVITKKPIVPSEQELAENPRSRSAKLRVAERTDYQP